MTVMRLSEYARIWGCDPDRLARFIATDPEWATFTRPEDADPPLVAGWPDYMFSMSYLDFWRDRVWQLEAEERTKK